MTFDPEYWKKRIQEVEQMIDELGSCETATERRRQAIEILILDRLDTIAQRVSR